MAEVEKKFLTGCQNSGIISQEKAEQIFGWIRESQRYSFNKSHGISYAMMGYWSAYCKANLNLEFLCSWFTYADKKQDTKSEIQGLVSEAKYMNIDVLPPYITSIFTGDYGDFSIGDNSINFGVKDIKKVGQKQVEKLMDALQKTCKRCDCSVSRIRLDDTINRCIV